MLRRVGGYLLTRDDESPPPVAELQGDGYTVLRSVLRPSEVARLREEIEQVYRDYPADGRAAAIRDPIEDEDFRYEMFNRSPLSQKVIAHPTILDTIEPLLGEDCHVIANTCWKNPPRENSTHGGGFWHIDAGPHIPRAPDVPWDERIPYPIFAIGAHIFLMDCDLANGATGVIPGSHKSGQPPPRDRYQDVDLMYNGQGVVAIVAKAGDVALFVSDVWHRRLPSSSEDTGRFFLQVHYGRRDIAQRIRPTGVVNHVSPEAEKRIESDRERKLLGLHPGMFYDG